MTIIERMKNRIQKRTAENTLAVFLCEDGELPQGYRRLSRCPEIIAGVNKISSLVASMSIHQMENGENGNKRIVDGISRVIDITPNSYMSRFDFIYWIVKTLYLDGDGNAGVMPVTSGGYIESLQPVPPGRIVYEIGGEYVIAINGKEYNPENFLHFALNRSCEKPYLGEGLTLQLKDVCETLTQSYATKKDFLSSKIMPSVVVNVNSDAEELQSEDGRNKLTKKYLSQRKKGEPWLIPSDLMKVEQIKPLTLSDIALPESIRLDKKQVASILDIPAFVLGEGNFDKEEWNNFIATRIMSLAQIIQQELTRKLLISDKRFFSFNPRSLMSYSITELAAVGEGMMTRGMMTGNEVRNWIGLDPKEGLDELIILENYIPAGMIGDQKKLKGGNENE